MRLSVCLAAAAVTMAAPALAHPQLVLAVPAVDATVRPTTTVRVVFSEPLVVKLSRAEVAMIAMPGVANHPAMKIASKTQLGPDGKTLVVAFPDPLTRGTYQVTYQVVSVDTHELDGSYEFKVS